MKTTLKLMTGLFLLALLLAPAMSAYASGAGTPPSEGKVIFGSNFELAKGETLGGDLVVFGGNVTIDEQAVVEGSLAVIGGNASVAKDANISGDVAMIGGNLQLNGSVQGDLAMIGGNASLGETALVTGNVTSMGGRLDRAEGAQVKGHVVNEGPAPTITIPKQVQAPNVPNAPWPNLNINFNPFSGFLGVIGQALGAAVIALLASLFLQPQMERVGSAITARPIVAGGFGLLAVALIFITMITIVLIPIGILGVVLIALAWLFGMVSLGQEVGERFSRSFHQTWNAPLTAGFGTFLLILVVGVVGLVPCLGWLASLLVGAMGVGGVALAFFGSRLYPQAPVAVAVDMPPAS